MTPGGSDGSINFVFKMMNFALKMANFALQMTAGFSDDDDFAAEKAPAGGPGATAAGGHAMLSSDEDDEMLIPSPPTAEEPAASTKRAKVEGEQSEESRWLFIEKNEDTFLNNDGVYTRAITKTDDFTLKAAPIGEEEDELDMS